jgi:tetratricopeptide (TPR) repeat protein
MRHASSLVVAKHPVDATDTSTMTMKRRLAIVAYLAALWAASACAAPADDIKALLVKGSAKAAYDLGKNHPDQLGNPAFDFYFGVAAIDSGHAGEGVLALERYLVNFPGNREAQLELARGYFVLGDYIRAREEFNTVLKLSPPRDVVANIDRYLDAIRARESVYRTTAGAFIEFGGGYDSNINGGVSNSSINLPGLGLLTVGQAGVKTRASFMQLSGGANVSHPVAPGLALFAGVSGDFRTHDSRREFDQNSAGIAGGISYLKEQNLFRATLNYSTLNVDYRRFRDVTGISGEWIRQLDELNTISGAVQYAKLDYATNNNVRDSNLKGISVGYRRNFVAPWQPLIALSASYAKEHNERNRDDLARDIYGLRAVVAASPAPRWALSAGLSYQQSNYEVRDFLSRDPRRDKYYGLDAVASYAITKALSVRGEAMFSVNRGNIELYEYKRGMLAIKLRYDLK